MKGCKDCKEYLKFYGEDIKCPKHRKPDSRGWHRVGCRKCDNVIINLDGPEDSLCGYCAL